MRLARVPRGEAEDARRRIMAADGLRKDARIMERGEEVLIPLTDDFDEDGARKLGLFIEEGEASPRPALVTPFEEATSLLHIPDSLKAILPRKWELLGDVLVLRLAMELEPYVGEIGMAYAEALNARTV